MEKCHCVSAQRIENLGGSEDKAAYVLTG